LKELYLSIFVLFFWLGVDEKPFSKSSRNALRGAVGISLIEMFLSFSAISWIEIATGRRDILDKYIWLFAIACMALYFTNLHFLATRGSGLAFAKHFKHFPKIKRVLLLSAAAVIFLTSAIVMFLSITAFQKAFNIHPPTGF